MTSDRLLNSSSQITPVLVFVGISNKYLSHVQLVATMSELSFQELSPCWSLEDIGNRTVSSRAAGKYGNVEDNHIMRHTHVNLIRAIQSLRFERVRFHCDLLYHVLLKPKGNISKFELLLLGFSLYVIFF